MAYMSFTEFSAPATERKVAEPLQAVPARFSPLEWTVVALARRDTVDTLATPSRLAKAMMTVFGEPHSNRLASDELEALRRMAVMLWHAPELLTDDELMRFEVAGYSCDHLELLRSSMNAGTRH